MFNHGVSVRQQATSLSTPIVADSGLPYVVGTAPVWAAEDPAEVDVPVLCTSYAEAISRLGYSDNWEFYTLCEFMDSHFWLFNCQPVIFCNVLDAEEMTETVSTADLDVLAHKIKLPLETVASTIVLKPTGGDGEAYQSDTDYALYYDDETLIIEALPDGAMYAADTVNLTYGKVTPASVSTADIADGIESIEQCITLFGTVPDLICAPGFSGDFTLIAMFALTFL